jgi:2-phospho-L-lactate/phosphoenolpyruvate guanylyltransferase
MRWSVVIPVKRLPLAKSRLYDGSRSRAVHRELALALALDTTAAALACGAVARVVAVTDDRHAAGQLTALGAVVVPDAPDQGLNPALAYGAVRALALAPGDGVAVLSADLAALRPAELDAALAAAATHGRAYVPDAAGSGTTLLTARPGVALDPRYGPGSRLAHRASGAVELSGAWPSLRQDVDTAADLGAAIRLGLGPATSAALAVG